MTSSGYLTTAGTAGMIDADTAGTTDFGTNGPPLAFFGSGRPDAAGLNIQAPTGSVYTFTGDQSELGAVFGARMWRKGVTNWVCVDGDTDLQRYNSQHTDVSSQIHIRRTNATQYVYFLLSGSIIATSGWNNELTDLLPAETSWNIGHTTVPLFEFGAISLGASPQVGSVRYQQYWNTTDNKARDTLIVMLFKGVTIDDDDEMRVQVTAPAVGAPWPSGDRGIGSRSMEELRELIEAEADPEKLQALRDELTALESNNE